MILTFLLNGTVVKHGCFDTMVDHGHLPWPSNYARKWINDHGDHGDHGDKTIVNHGQMTSFANNIVSATPWLTIVL